MPPWERHGVRKGAPKGSRSVRCPLSGSGWPWLPSFGLLGASLGIWQYPLGSLGTGNGMRFPCTRHAHTQRIRTHMHTRVYKAARKQSGAPSPARANGRPDTTAERRSRGHARAHTGRKALTHTSVINAHNTGRTCTHSSFFSLSHSLTLRE